jgi:hypothetical protein
MQMQPIKDKKTSISSKQLLTSDQCPGSNRYVAYPHQKAEGKRQNTQNCPGGGVA